MRPDSKAAGELFQEVIDAFNACLSATSQQREESLEDRRFATIAGAMWEGDLGELFANRPRLEVNKISLAVIRIFNEYRNNRISVDFISKEGEEEDDLADTCDALYRADEMDGCGEEAYDNAFDEAVLGGFGAWRLTSEYEDEYDDDDDRQRIRFEPIFDADTTVFFDPAARKQDKSDARWCMVLTPMSKDAYKEEWGDDPDSWGPPITEGFDWVGDAAVYVAEYYRVEEGKEKVITYRAIDGSEEKYTEKNFEDDEGLERRLRAVGSKKVREKDVRRRVVRKFILSGNGLLEDCGNIPGKEIPIIPVFGKRWFVDGIERWMGHVRLAKDAQRLKNAQLSMLAETAAYSSIEKPIFAPEQVAGLETYWAEDSRQNFPYMLANPITDDNGNIQQVGPMAYTKSPTVPQSTAALLEISEQDIADILGRQEQGEEIDADLSGKAIELIQNRLDMQAFIYMSNMAKAVRRCGQVWLSMANDLYVEEGRKMRGIGEQEEIRQVTLGENSFDGPVTDMTKARFDVAVDVGPTSSSRRSATVRALTSMLGLVQDPMDQAVLSAMAMMNMEGEGIQPVRDYFRKKLVQMGVIDPTDTEREEMAQQQQQPDAQQMYLISEAEKNRADAQETLADVELKKVETQHEAVKVGKTQAETQKIMREARFAGIGGAQGR